MPTIVELQSQKDKEEWLITCYDICQAELPPEVFAAVHPDIWKLLPWGHRLVVMRIPEDEKYGDRIVIPEGYRQVNAAGWVLTVGTEVCIPDTSRYPSVCPYEHPHDLVGARVNFGQYAGVPIIFHAIDSPWEGRYVQLSIGDIHAEVLE